MHAGRESRVGERPARRSGCRPLLVATSIAALGLIACSKSQPAAPAAVVPPPTTSTPPTYTLSGTVTDEETGRGVNGAEVRVFVGPNTGRTATTDGNGAFSLTGLVSSGFSYRVTAAGYSQTSQSVTLTSDMRVTVKIRSSIRTITGVVTDATSHGVLPNILIESLDPSFATVWTRTDAAGAYSLSGVTRAEVSVVASAESYETIATNVDSGGSMRVDIELSRDTNTRYVFVGFDGIGGDGARFSSYVESSFTVTAISGSWFNARGSGNPSPSIELRPADGGIDISGELEIAARGRRFQFEGLDYATPLGLSNILVTGYRSGAPVYIDLHPLGLSGGVFFTTGNTFATRPIELLRLRISGTATGPVRVDNIVLSF